jgi:predicted small lipoprotein YifL
MRNFTHLLLVAGLVAVSLSLSLSACGKKGDPVIPEDTDYPRQYPGE